MCVEWTGRNCVDVCVCVCRGQAMPGGFDRYYDMVLIGICNIDGYYQRVLIGILMWY